MTSFLFFFVLSLIYTFSKTETGHVRCRNNYRDMSWNHRHHDRWVQLQFSVEPKVLFAPVLFTSPGILMMRMMWCTVRYKFSMVLLLIQPIFSTEWRQRNNWWFFGLMWWSDSLFSPLVSCFPPHLFPPFLSLSPLPILFSFSACESPYSFWLNRILCGSPERIFAPPFDTSNAGVFMSSWCRAVLFCCTSFSSDRERERGKETLLLLLNVVFVVVDFGSCISLKTAFESTNRRLIISQDITCCKAPF